MILSHIPKGINSGVQEYWGSNVELTCALRAAPCNKVIIHSATQDTADPTIFVSYFGSLKRIQLLCCSVADNGGGGFCVQSV